MVVFESAAATVIGFLVTLLIGALGIYIGARVIADVDDYSYAIITALIGAIVWAVVTFLVGWIPLLGIVLALLAWVWVINWRYPGGWVNAALIGLVAWISVVVVQYLLAVLGIATFEALGIPGA